MSLISIIVPIYNVEEKLERCLLSIRNQSYQKLEIICVNDGSPDKSLEIVKSMMKEDSRIVLVDKKNGGLSSARNAGLKIAKGEYVGFVDSDDYIDHSMYKCLISMMEKESSDLVCCGANLVNELDEKVELPLKNYLKVPNKTIFTNPLLLLDLNVYAWNKIYRKDIIEKFKIEFPEGRLYEDSAFLYMYLFHTKKVSFISEKLYCYVQHNASIMGQTKNNKNLKALDHIEILYPAWMHLAVYKVPNQFASILLEVSWKYIGAAFKNLPNDKKTYALKDGVKLFRYVYNLELDLFKFSKLRFYFLCFYRFNTMILRKVQRAIWGRKI